MTEREKNQICTILKEQIEQDYGIPIKEFSLLRVSENVTFHMIAQEGTQYIVRLNKANYHSLEELQGEIVWMDAIRQDTNLEIPDVISNKKGTKIGYVEGCHPYGCYYSIFSFVEGKTISEKEDGISLETMKEIGALAAKLHAEVENNVSLRKLKRFTWNYEDLFGDNPRWGLWSDNLLLTQENRDTIGECLQIIEQKLLAYGKNSSNYGLIHSDLHMSNIMVENGRYKLIDFDDCGYGWFLFECGCSVMQFNEQIEGYTQAWLNGYQRERCLTSEDLQMVWSFVLLRRIARIGWLWSHGGMDRSQEIQEYIDCTQKLADRYRKKELRIFS